MPAFLGTLKFRVLRLALGAVLALAGTLRAEPARASEAMVEPGAEGEVGEGPADATPDHDGFTPAQAARLTALAHSRAWLKLLHYEPTLLGGARSQADGPEFFLHPEGSRRPLEELRATFLAFARANAAAGDASPACRFPARWLLLRKSFPKEAAQWPKPACPKFEAFREGLSAESATLVFSSYYLNNPSSTFGHTLLRLNKKRGQGQGRHELLDYGVNYAAVTDTANPFIYAFSGMFGFFRGGFASVPYYYKVQEYNDYESRDLWEYELALAPAEMEMLVAHLWELGHTFFYYYYLTENCSYHMLTALEAASPRLRLIDDLPFWVIPADTIKAARASEELVTGLRYRPSKRSAFQYRAGLLSERQRDELARILGGRAAGELAADESLAASERIAVLDAAIDHFDFKNFRALIAGEPAATQGKQQLLIARSRIASPSPDAAVPMPEREIPHEGHGSSRSGFGYAYDSDDRRSLLLSHRFALHDLLDPQKGYPRDGEIEFFHLQGRLYDDHEGKRLKKGKIVEVRGHDVQARLDHFYAFQVRSFGPIDRFNRNFSWRTRVGLERTWDRSCDDCLAGGLGAGFGATVALDGSETLLLTSLLAVDAWHSHRFRGGRFKAGLGPELNLRWIAAPNLVLQVNAIYERFLLVSQKDGFRVSEEARYGLNKDWSFAVSAVQAPGDYFEGRGSLYFYY